MAESSTSNTRGDCFHCGLPVPEGANYSVEIQGEEQAMCCHGCQAVAQAIVDGGLVAFYQHRTTRSRKPEDLVPEELRRFDLYDQPTLQESFVEVSDASKKSASLILEGISCAACVWLNERHVRALPGVVDFQVNYSTHRARVVWDDSQLHLSDILKAITEIGYVAHPFDPGRQEQVFKKEKSTALRRLVIAGLAAMQVMMLAVALYAGHYSGMESSMRDFLRWVSLFLATPVVFYSSSVFFKSAWRDLKHRQLGMDVPVSLAIGVAFAASIWSTIFQGEDVYFDSVCMFSFFLLTSRYLEMGARHRAGQAAEELVKLLPATATLISDEGEELVAVADLMEGDRVLIRPGESVPADGEVISGISSVDESLLTGESLPRPRQEGDQLVGGSVNVESPLQMRVEKVGEETLISAIVRLLDRAQSEKPRMAQLADKVAGWFVAVILMLAFGVAVSWYIHDPSRAFAVTLSVLVVTCPCALSLATPTAITAASGALTRLGFLTTRGHALETLARVSHILFDKTGTLTRGNLRLLAVKVLGAMEKPEVAAIAAALEGHSEHPVGRVLAAEAKDKLVISDIQSYPGQGMEGIVTGQRYRIGTPAFAAKLANTDAPAISATAATSVVLASEKELLAIFELEDALRQDAESSINKLISQGFNIEILSGDAQGPVTRVAGSLGIEKADWGLKPEDKLDRVRQLQAEGHRVAMIGDGVNDAPVLAGADVSIAVGSGAQLAHASADMVMLSEHLAVLPQGVATARRTLRIIKQNLSWALIYNLTAIPLAAAGLVAPWMAAIGMSMSSLVVVFNASRLRKIPES